ncbi:MAG TPA: AraC family transcriptional regulator [Rhizobacter sp.]|nr:AraC family transcriptional regulator [Rhizobacter sp.]
MPSLVRAAALTNFAELSRGFGLDPQRLMSDAGLQPNVLNDPDLRIPVERVGDLLERAAALSGCESFGLRMAETRQLSNLGPVGLLIRDQPTLRESLAVLLRYHLALNGGIALVIEEEAGVVVIREEVTTGKPGSVRQGVELAVGVMLRLMRQFLGPDWRPRRVCFTHEAPRDITTHLRVFGPCVEFRHDFNGIVCGRQDLDTVNPHADPAMARYAQQLLDVALRQVETEPRMIEDVRRAALLLLPSGRCSIEQVAEQLGLACRTVQRRLADEGTSFSELVNALRVELAQRHVSGSTRPLTEVAALLGFSAPSGFSRWYSGQFGHSPSEERQRAKA